MNVEHLLDNHNVVNEEGDVVSFHDIMDIEVDNVGHFESDLESAHAASIESSLRDHPASQDLSEPEISKLAQELISELRQQHKRRRKARAIFAVLKNPTLSSEDRSVIAIEAGLPVDVFEQSEGVEVVKPTSGATRQRQDYSQQDSGFADYGKAAANDRD